VDEGMDDSSFHLMHTYLSPDVLGANAMHLRGSTQSTHHQNLTACAIVERRFPSWLLAAHRSPVKGNDPCRFHHPSSSEAVPLLAPLPWLWSPCHSHQKRRLVLLYRSIWANHSTQACAETGWGRQQLQRKGLFMASPTHAEWLWYYVPCLKKFWDVHIPLSFFLLPSVFTLYSNPPQWLGAVWGFILRLRSATSKVR
jgi:hypothetical protein